MLILRPKRDENGVKTASQRRTSPNIQSRRLSWIGHVTRMVEDKSFQISYRKEPSWNAYI